MALSCDTCKAPLCISRIALFRNLTNQQQRLIIDHVTRKEFKKNDILISENQTLSQFVIVNEGRFKAYTTSLEGKQNMLYFFGLGDFFGQHALFEKEQMAYTVEAMENSSVCMIESDILKTLMIQHPEMALSIMSALSSRVSYLEHELSSVHLEKVQERLLGLLYDLSKDYGQIQGESIVLHLPLSQEEMAMRLGVSRESVSRNFKKLIKASKIEMHNKKEVILPRV